MPNLVQSLSRPERREQVQAWGVHLFTASGALWGFLALIAIIQEEWLIAVGWMAVAFLVDSFDGMLARRFRVKDVLPTFDGALLDNMVDYFTYTIVPALFLYQAELLPPEWALLGISIMVLASSYQFAQSDAKTDGNNYFFKGFPSYWNVMVIYLWMLEWSSWANLGAVLFLSLLVFVPIEYVYHSRTIQYRRLTLLLSAAWGIVVFVSVLMYPNHSKLLLYGSLLYAVYYAGMSLYLMMKRR